MFIHIHSYIPSHARRNSRALSLVLFSSSLLNWPNTLCSNIDRNTSTSSTVVSAVEVEVEEEVEELTRVEGIQMKMKMTNTKMKRQWQMTNKWRWRWKWQIQRWKDNDKWQIQMKRQQWNINEWVCQISTLCASGVPTWNRCGVCFPIVPIALFQLWPCWYWWWVCFLVYPHHFAAVKFLLLCGTALTSKNDFLC